MGYWSRSVVKLIVVGEIEWAEKLVMVKSEAAISLKTYSLKKLNLLNFIFIFI